MITEPVLVRPRSGSKLGSQALALRSGSSHGRPGPSTAPAPGKIALVTPDGEAREVADDLAFLNGMVVTPDNATLIVAESGRAHPTNLASTAGRQTAMMIGRAMSDRATVGTHFL